MESGLPQLALDAFADVKSTVMGDKEGEAAGQLREVALTAAVQARAFEQGERSSRAACMGAPPSLSAECPEPC